MLIAHSQGGILAARWMASHLCWFLPFFAYTFSSQDQLLADFPIERLANSKCTPSPPPPTTSPPQPSESEKPRSPVLSILRTRTISLRESVRLFNKYVSSHWLIPERPCPTGVLEFSNRPSTATLRQDSIAKVQARYAGRVFLRTGHTGHLLLSH